MLSILPASSPFTHGKKEPKEQDVLIIDGQVGAASPTENDFIVRNEKENYDDYSDFGEDARVYDDDDDDDDDDVFDLYEDEGYIADGK